MMVNGLSGLGFRTNMPTEPRYDPDALVALIVALSNIVAEDAPLTPKSSVSLCLSQFSDFCLHSLLFHQKHSPLGHDDRISPTSASSFGLLMIRQPLPSTAISASPAPPTLTRAPSPTSTR